MPHGPLTLEIAANLRIVSIGPSPEHPESQGDPQRAHAGDPSQQEQPLWPAGPPTGQQSPWPVAEPVAEAWSAQHDQPTVVQPAVSAPIPAHLTPPQPVSPPPVSTPPAAVSPPAVVSPPPVTLTAPSAAPQQAWSGQYGSPAPTQYGPVSGPPQQQGGQYGSPAPAPTQYGSPTPAPQQYGQVSGPPQQGGAQYGQVSGPPHQYGSPTSAPPPQQYGQVSSPPQQYGQVSGPPQQYASPTSAPPQQQYGGPVSSPPQQAWSGQYGSPTSAPPQQYGSPVSGPPQQYGSPVSAPPQQAWAGQQPGTWPTTQPAQAQPSPQPVSAQPSSQQWSPAAATSPAPPLGNVEDWESDGSSRRGRTVLWLLIGLLVGALVAGPIGYFVSDSSGVAEPKATGSPSPGPGASLSAYETVRKDLNKQKLSGDLAALGDPWLPYLGGCTANTDPNGPALNQGEKLHVACMYGGIAAHFAIFETAATRDEARDYHVKLNTEAANLAPGLAAPEKKNGAQTKAPGQYIEYAFRLSTGITICGVWWDRDDNSSALTLEAICDRELDGKWEPLRELWQQYS